MKKALLLLCLLLTLSACGKQTPIISSPPKDTTEEPAAPAVKPEAETGSPAVKPEKPAEPSSPDKSEPETDLEPEAVPTPEAEPELPPLPPLPLPVYCFEDTAVDAKGQILLQLPGQQLQVLADSGTGQLRGIVAIDPQAACITGLYNLLGQPILEDLNAYECGWYADLFWYGSPLGYTVRCLSEDRILYENMAQVAQAGDALLVQPPFWNTSCVLLDGSGEILRELDRSFRLVRTYETPEQTYLVMAARTGEETLADPTGSTYLGRFYDEVAQVRDKLAVVRDGSTWLVVDLATGNTVFRQDLPITLLSDSLLLETETPGQTRLVSFQGTPLYEKPLKDALLLDANGDGEADWIAAKELRDEIYCTVLLDLQGQELLVLEAEPASIVPVSPQLLFTAISTGEGAFFQEGTLHNVYSNEALPLLKGRFLQAQVVQTSEQVLLLCQGLLPDNTAFYRLFTTDGELVLPDFELTGYAGGDVFETPDGLLCLNDVWLYRK